MRLFQWLTLLFILLASFLVNKASPTEGVLFEDIYRAVINSYDVNASFDENMDIILRLFCPELSATSCDVSQEDEVPLPLYKNTSSDVNNIAREFLKQNTHYMNGCCSKCSCKNTCYVNGNCCYSKRTQHGQANPKHARSRCVTTNIKSHSSRYAGVQFPNSYFMVTECFDDILDIEVANKCLEPDITISDEVIPVVSKTTEIVYWNRYCAKCNNDINIESWDIQISFEQYYRALLSSLKFPDSLSDFLQLGLIRAINIEFIPPANSNLAYEDYSCIPERHRLKSQCTSSGKQINIGKLDGEIMDRACSRVGTAYTSFIGLNYANVFCYLCNHKRRFFAKGGSCDTLVNRQNSYSMYGLLNGISDTTPANVVNRRRDNCTCQEIFDSKQEQCRKVSCPFMERYVGCACVSFVVLYGMEVNAFFEVRSLSNGALPKKWKMANEKNVAKLKSAVKNIFGQIGPVTIQYYAIFQGSDHSGNFFYFASSITPKSGNDSLKVLGDIFTQLNDGISLSVEGTAFRISIGKKFRWELDLSNQFALSPSENETLFITKRLFSVRDEELFDRFMRTEILSQLLFCKQIFLTDKEKEVFANTTDLSKTKSTNTIGDVKGLDIEDDSVKICFEDFVKIFQVTNNTEVFGWFSSWCMLCCLLSNILFYI